MQTTITATDTAAFFRAVSGIRSSFPRERLDAITPLFTLARGHGVMADKARQVLEAEFGPDAWEYEGPGGGCAAPHAMTRICEELGWECGTCAWGWPPNQPATGV